MNSVILMTTARLLISMLMLFAIFLLVRGHNAPGGGFVAGLVVTSAIGLYALAFDIRSARSILRLDPRVFIAIGLLLALVSGIPGLVQGDPFLTGIWVDFKVGQESVKLGTPLLFDLGVFFVVIGMATIAILSLAEEEG